MLRGGGRVWALGALPHLRTGALTLPRALEHAGALLSVSAHPGERTSSLGALLYLDTWRLRHILPATCGSARMLTPLGALLGEQRFQAALIRLLAAI